MEAEFLPSCSPLFAASATMMTSAPGCFVGTDRACIWYWVNLMKIEKDRHLGFLFSHILNHICRGQYQHVSFSDRYADLGAYFQAQFLRDPVVSCSFVCPLLSFFIYFIITWLRWGPCLCSRSLLFFSGLNRKHIVCLFTLLQVLRWCQFRYQVALNRVTCSMILTPDVVFITSCLQRKGNCQKFPNWLDTCWKQVHVINEHNYS